AAANPARAAEAAQDLDRRVRADAEHREERLAQPVAGEEDDPRAERRVRRAQVDGRALAAHLAGAALDPREAAEELLLSVPLRAGHAEDLAPAQREVDRAEPPPA